MDNFHQILVLIEGAITGYWFVGLLLATGLFYTIYLGFPQVRYFVHAIKVVMGKYDDENDQGDTSHFQALTTALSGTVGTGNIAGVALAVHLGGPASIFWMLVTAFLGMTTKFVEVTLSHKYREVAEDGTMAGGPMYYMKNKLNWRWMAVIFAIGTLCCAMGSGNLPQINSIANAIHATFGIEHIITGGVLAAFLALVIVGGISRIASVTEKLVPAMALIYLVGALAVIFYNAENIIPSFISIFSNIFSGTAATGGFLGATVAFALDRGVNRGLFSNEAGQGSAAIAHAAAKTDEPLSEGLVAILEPFIDTIVICTLTGLVLLSSGVWNEKYDNKFQNADLHILSKVYDENNQSQKAELAKAVQTSNLPLYSGELRINNGKIDKALTIIHARSVAEDVRVYEVQDDVDQDKLYNGILLIENGKLTDENASLYLQGKSLLHSSPLTTKAFTKSYFGSWGKYIVSIGLLLFAFSSAISWSYYGDRAITFLFGTKAVLPFRIVYVIVFFTGAFVDTTIVWTIAGISVAMMVLPNLVGILSLHKDMKNTVKGYWERFREEHGE